MLKSRRSATTARRAGILPQPPTQPHRIMTNRARGALLGGILCFSCLSAHAADPWSQADKAREVVYLAIVAVDWGQTLDFQHHPELSEANPVLGPHPSRARINTLIPAAMLLHAAVVHYLPEQWRAVFQYTTLSIELGAVHNNYRLGLKLAF